MPIHQSGIAAHHILAYHGRQSQSAAFSRGAAGSIVCISTAVFIAISSQTDYSRNLPQRHTRPYATLSFLSQESIFRIERTDMASTAPASPRSARTGRSIASVDTLRRKALEKLTLAITKAVEAASADPWDGI